MRRCVRTDSPGESRWQIQHPIQTELRPVCRAEWSAAADGWHESIRTLAQYLEPPTETMLDLAGVQAGDRVLDVATGAGGQAILAARRVGPSGFVLATDISRQMLDFTEAEIERAGLTNVETRIMDGENLQLPERSFDAVIYRGGLEFFPTPEEALAQMPEDELFLRSMAAYALGIARRATGDLAEAVAAMQTARLASEQAGNAMIGWLGSAALGDIEIMQGRLRQAAETYREVLAQQDGKPLLPRIEAYVHLGDLYREWNDFAEASGSCIRAWRW